jgi:prepilin-type N-terminal cleavage/methylation domain-containing protein
MQTHKQGFTLNELLVVIAVLSILASLTIASYAQARRYARDGRRKTDTKAYVAAIEQQRITTGSYGVAEVGNGGNGWGRVNHSAETETSKDTIAEKLQKQGYLGAVSFDPLVHSAGDLRDYVLVLCGLNGNQLQNAADFSKRTDEAASVWTALEGTVNGTDSKNAERACGGAGAENTRVGGYFDQASPSVNYATSTKLF